MLSRYSYGPVQLDSISGAVINVSAVSSYSRSSIEMFQDGQLLSSGESSWNTIDLAGGSQSTISLVVLNQDSRISLQYELIVIRPLPVCTNSQLSQWYVASLLVERWVIQWSCRSAWAACEVSCSGALSQVERTRIIQSSTRCGAVVVEQDSVTCGSKSCDTQVEGRSF